MKKLSVLILCLLAISTVSAAEIAESESAESAITLEAIAQGQFRAQSVGQMSSMPDGDSYAQLSDDGKLILRYDYRSGQLLDTLFNADRTRESKMGRTEGFRLNAQGTKMLLWNNRHAIYRRSFLADYYVYDCRHGILKPLSENGQQRDAQFSPDGHMVAFGRDNNLFIKKLDYWTEVAVTTDGKTNEIINGVSDWLYEEEFSTTRLFEWTSDSRYLCYVRLDESKVPEYSFQRYYASDKAFKDNEIYPGEYRYKYPSAGQPNSRASLLAYQVIDRSTRRLDLGLDSEDYIPVLRHTCRTNEMAVMVLNRWQNEFKMYFVNPKSTLSKLVLTERNNAYVDYENLQSVQFTSKDFTYVSEKDGFRHLYLYNLNGTLKARLTEGEQELLSYYGRDTLNGWFYYQRVDEVPYRQAICRCNAKGKSFKLSSEPGSHRAQFNSSFTYYVDNWSDVNTPNVHTLCRADGKPVRTLEDNASLRRKLAGTPHAEKSFFETPAADGTPLYGWMVRPRDFDENRQYPLLLVQYSGPDSQEAIDEYSFDWEYFLAEQGYVVACVDGRGTAARGERFRKQTYLNLGQMESADQCEVAKALGSRSYIDASRIGIWGWSYGGFITLMSLTQPTPVFKAGIAIAPVTDFRYYDSAYTERFMRRPQENPDGYESASVIAKASQLQGNLLLIHGLADDNVRTNQSMELIDALVRAGKPFDLMLYPNKNHSILGVTYRTDLYRRWWAFLQEKL